MLREHGIAAVIYGGTYLDEDFRDRKVADEWFTSKYNLKLTMKDMEATTKYRFDPDFGTGGTFGVNYAKAGGGVIAFNYRSMFMTEEERLDIHKKLIVDHYLKQFNEETIATKSYKTCGEPCAAVCKKMKDEFKKDYEPYQAMGPLCGIFDQRAAEKLNHHADMLGFDAISVGGVLSWLMDCRDANIVTSEDLGVKGAPVFQHKSFSVETDSMTNADLGVQLLDSIIARRGLLDFGQGARKLARTLAPDRGRDALDRFLFISNARNGWMVPNQYWTPGVLSPMAIMGKYYMHYGSEFLPPGSSARHDAGRILKELVMDNAGICRFHREWAEEMVPEIVGCVFGVQGAVRRGSRDGEPHQFAKRFRLLGIRAQHRPRPDLPGAAPRRGEEARPELLAGSTSSKRTGRRRPSTTGSKYGRASTRACASSTPSSRNGRPRRPAPCSGPSG